MNNQLKVVNLLFDLIENIRSRNEKVANKLCIGDCDKCELENECKVIYHLGFLDSSDKIVD